MPVIELAPVIRAATVVAVPLNALLIDADAQAWIAFLLSTCRALGASDLVIAGRGDLQIDALLVQNLCWGFHRL
jgi:hypothetical protein